MVIVTCCCEHRAGGSAKQKKKQQARRYKSSSLHPARPAQTHGKRPTQATFVILYGLQPFHCRGPKSANVIHKHSVGLSVLKEACCSIAMPAILQ